MNMKHKSFNLFFFFFNDTATTDIYTLSLNDALPIALLLNGVNQLSYTVTDPDTFPNAPPMANLSLAQNSIYRLDPKLRSDYMMQSAIGVERQLPRSTTVAVTYTNTRALHLNQTVPINTPLPGTYIPSQPSSGLRPYGLNAGNLFERSEEHT